MVGLRQREEVNKFSSFLLRYQPSATNTLPLISPIAHEVRAKNNGRCSKVELGAHQPDRGLFLAEQTG